MITVLGISTTILVSDSTAAAIVTTMRDGRAATQTGQTATIFHGVALATFRTGQIEAKVGKQEWEDALANNHIRVKFNKPQAIVLNVTSGEFRGKKSLAASGAFPRSVTSLGDGGLASIAQKCDRCGAVERARGLDWGRVGSVWCVPPIGDIPR